MIGLDWRSSTAGTAHRTQIYLDKLLLSVTRKLEVRTKKASFWRRDAKADRLN